MFYHVVVEGDRAVWIQAARSKCAAHQAVKDLTKRSAYEKKNDASYSIRSFWTKDAAATFIKQSLGCK